MMSRTFTSTFAIIFAAAFMRQSNAFSQNPSFRKYVSPLPVSASEVTSPQIFGYRTVKAIVLSHSATVKHDDSASIDKFRKYTQFFSNLFPLWIVVTASTAMKFPYLYLGIPPSTFPAQIGLLMLCMGISLKPADFRRVFQRPGTLTMC